MEFPQIERRLSPPGHSFFLFGPRGTGKSTWLRRSFPRAHLLDLLNSSLFLELARSPGNLEAMIGHAPAGTWVVLDEVQKLPGLLDEVHRLIETHRWNFSLCGSSARKLRRGGTNLLGGRAITQTMEGFSLAELGKYAELDSVLQYGTLPIVWSHLGSAPEVLDAYVHTYMKQEIQEEGLVRKISPFLRFLGVAGQLNGQVVNGHGIARDAGVPRATVDTYFSILFDTLLGHLLPAWRPEAKVREAVHPKFYWFDPGVARAAAGYTFDPPDRTWLGFALETILFHELRVYNTTSAKHRGISYYRTPAGIEVDFVIETTKRQATKKPHVVLIESKLSPAWDRRWEKPMLDLAAQSSLTVDRMFGVYNGNRTYHFGPVTVVPVVRFVEMLFEGNVF